MARYLLARLAVLALLTFAVSLLTFSMLSLAKGDPAEIILRSRMAGEQPSPAAVALLREEMGLNDSFPVRYAKWVGRAARGDLGYSFRTGRKVSADIADRFPRTAALAGAAILVCILLAIPMGVISAARRGKSVDHLVVGGSIVLVSVPQFWLGTMLVLFFALRLGLFPVAGSERAIQYVLPALTLGLGISATTARLTRSTMLEVLLEDYIRTARAKGLSEGAVFFKHALRNALVPIVTNLGMNFRYLLGGVVFVEMVFSFKGIGLLLLDGIMSRDFPVVQGCVLLIVVLTVLLNLAVDLSYVIIDPRIRLAGTS